MRSIAMYLPHPAPYFLNFFTASFISLTTFSLNQSGSSTTTCEPCLRISIMISASWEAGMVRTSEPSSYSSSVWSSCQTSPLIQRERSGVMRSTTLKLCRFWKMPKVF